MRNLFSLFLIYGFIVLNEAYAQTNVLDTYIMEGLSNNLVLKQRNISLDKALLALQTAKSMYQPSVDFQATYTSATGGRNIQLPLGQLLNPVYSTLNQLTGTGAFPSLADESINFLPRNYYDAKVRTTVPIINTDLTYNKRINEEQVTLKSFEVDTYQRELVKNIKTAYYQYLSAIQAVAVYESALNLAKESKRINESLLTHGKGLHAYVLRSESEIEQVEADIFRAQQQQSNAGLYFNSLLNRQGEEDIVTDFNADEALLKASSMLQDAVDVKGREEFKSLQHLIKINETLVGMNKKFAIPRLNGFVDVGSQAEQMQFNNQSRYVMFGVQLDLPIYNGNRNRFKIKQSLLDLQDAQYSTDHVMQQLGVSGQVAKNNLSAAWGTYRSSLKQLEAAESYQRLIEKGYKAGTNTYIETIDARNQLTMARLATLVNKYDVLLAATNFEREVASYPIKN